MDPTIAVDPVRAFADPPHVDDAAELLAAAPLDAIVYGFTSSSYVRGAADHVVLNSPPGNAHAWHSGGCPCAAAAEALAVLGVKRLALINPPWFSDELSRQGDSYFEGLGFEVVYHGRAGLPLNQQANEPAEVYEWVRRHTPANAEAVFIGGNGFRAVAAIGALEQALARPVLTANQVAFWSALRVSKRRAVVTGYGRIFER